MKENLAAVEAIYPTLEDIPNDYLAPSIKKATQSSLQIYPTEDNLT